MPKINLPLVPQPAKVKTPKRSILFSKPKVGKTAIVSKLPKCLILDFEEGTLAVESMAVQIKSFADLYDVLDAVKEANYPYSFGAIDTVSALEELCNFEAEVRYSQTVEGKDWFKKDPTDPNKYHKASGKYQYGNIINLPWGKGYQLVADIFNEVIVKVEKHFPKIILLAHSSITTLTKDGAETTTLDIQLSKKSKFMATFKADAIGYVYRNGKQNLINFTAGDDVSAGGRHRYLEKEPIVISEFVDHEDGTEELITYWEKIFAPEKKIKTK